LPIPRKGLSKELVVSDFFDEVERARVERAAPLARRGRARRSVRDVWVREAIVMDCVVWCNADVAVDNPRFLMVVGKLRNCMR
jgi:hypothetical protein